MIGFLVFFTGYHLDAFYRLSWLLIPFDNIYLLISEIIVFLSTPFFLFNFCIRKFRRLGNRDILITFAAFLLGLLIPIAFFCYGVHQFFSHPTFF